MNPLPHTSSGIEEQLKYADEYRERYPYSPLADIALLNSAARLSSDDRSRIASRIATNLGAPDSMRRVLGDSEMDFDTFYPDQLPLSPSTEETIDTFLAKYGKPADSRETDILEKAMFTPRPTFEAEFAAQGVDADAIPDDPTAQGIDSFLEAHRSDLPEPPVNLKYRSREADSADTSLTESLAKVMIKNGNYQKALEIISDLSLSNPKKMLYFADQMRFLKKLIINQKHKK